MKKTMLALALVTVLSGCGGGADPDPQAAQQMKQQVDGAVRDVVPELVDALNAEVRAAGGSFIECQMKPGQYKYRAGIGLFGGSADVDEVIAVLEDAGFDEITSGDSDGSSTSVSARREPVEIDVPTVEGSAGPVSNVEILVDCTPLADAGQEFADDDPGEDYTDLR